MGIGGKLPQLPDGHNVPAESLDKPAAVLGDLLGQLVVEEGGCLLYTSDAADDP